MLQLDRFFVLKRITWKFPKVLKDSSGWHCSLYGIEDLLKIGELHRPSINSSLGYLWFFKHSADPAFAIHHETERNRLHFFRSIKN